MERTFVLSDGAAAQSRPIALVRPWFEQIGAQLRRLTRAGGGPIVAVQVENELYDQPGHLLTIKRLAGECGIDAPLWTATGLGHAQLPPGEVLPVFGGYSEFAWPLNRALGGALLRWASAQVVCVLDGPEPVLVLTQTAGLPVELALARRRSARR